MGLLIPGGMIVTMNPEGKIWKVGALSFKGDRIQDIGPQEDILKSYPDIPAIKVLRQSEPGFWSDAWRSDTGKSATPLRITPSSGADPFFPQPCKAQ